MSPAMCVDVKFAVHKLGAYYHVVAVQEDGKPLMLIEGTATQSGHAAEYMHSKIKDCPTCKRQAMGWGGPTHFGSKNCRCGSPASGGDRPHCSCSTCF